MPKIRIAIADLFAFEDTPQPANADLPFVTTVVVRQFGFLPKPLGVQLEGSDVVIEYPEESPAAQQEAARLAERAGKRAAEGDYDKAIGILKRVLELQPSLHRARRDLAMAYVEKRDVDNAVNHLIEVLRYDPKDAWSWVVLGNLYLREKDDLPTGEKFIRKALEIAPNDAWALNSLAAAHYERGKLDEALSFFDKAIASNPDFANAYVGKAMTLDGQRRPTEGIATLERMFTNAKMQDARSRPVFENARRVFGKLHMEIAERHHSEAFKAVQAYKAEVETLSGLPVRIEEAEFQDKIGATIQIAWKHGRDYHLIKTRRGFPEHLLVHLEAHELTHLKLESEARRANKNQFFATTAKTREFAIRSFENEIRRWQKQGYSEESITKVTLSIVSGLCGFLFNCPLDMLIERQIRQALPVLRSPQFLSVSVMANEAWETNSNAEVRRLTPKRVMNASLALNGAYALFVDDLFAGGTDFASKYRTTEPFQLSQRLWNHWQNRSKNLSPGDEYRIVDEFADMVGLSGWYEWQADPGDHTVTEGPRKEGTTNPELLKEKHPAAIFYFLDAFQRFDEMSAQDVKKVTLEVAMTGMQGLDYASPEEKYELRSVPGRRFSGLHLMCLMYAGFKRFAPEHDVGMDLHDPFLTAMQMYQKKGNK